MKIALREIEKVAAALSGARITTLEESEQSLIFDLNCALRAVLKPYEEKKEDISTRLRPADFEELQDLQPKVEAGTATQEEVGHYITGLHAYTRSLNKHLKPLLDELHEVAVEPIDMSVWKKVLKENKWPIGVLNDLETVTK